MFNSKLGIGVLKHPGYNGKGGGGSSSQSTAKDFFGVGQRKPYEEALRDLLLGGGPSLEEVKATPGFMLGRQMGQEGLERRFAATGVGPSGYENLAINNFNNEYAGNYYQNYKQNMIANLMTASGAGMSPITQTTSSSQGQSPLWGVAGTVAGALPWAKWFSDKNLKTNIKHIDTVKGIKIYSFNYIWSKLKSVGVMAQDLLEMPEYKHAVELTKVGYTVDYSKLSI